VKTAELFRIFIFLSCLGNLNAEENFDFAFSLSNAGWGMNVSPHAKEGEITLKFFNLFIEHRKSNIGLELSPFRTWGAHDFSNLTAGLLNAGLYYNLLGSLADAERTGSDYMLAGPFVSLNYLQSENFNRIDAHNLQINVGLKSLAMFDYSTLFGEKSLPIGFYLFDIELGYKYSNFTNNNHQFYFTLSTDVLSVLYVIGLVNDKPKEIEDQIEREKKKRR
jgi:hypothetical protein